MKAWGVVAGAVLVACAGNPEPLVPDPPHLPPVIIDTLPDPPDLPEPPVVEVPTPAGNVFLENRAFADDDGPHAAWGASLFWGLWAAHEDEAMLHETLDWLASWGVDYVRVLGTVGALPYWEGRVVDTAWPDYAETLNRLLDACAERGLRVQITLFADAQVMMPDQEDRMTWIETMSQLLEDRRPVVQFVEIANESGLNGIEDEDLAALTTYWDDISNILVAPSSPDGDNAEVALNRLFDEHTVAADLLTPHFDRFQSEEGYRPHRQPWEAQFYETETTVFTSNEPIGPGSSGESDSDPARLAIGMANTFLSGGSAYVLHSDAGVRGDVPYWERVSDDVMRALRAVRDLLPPDIANASTANHTWDTHPYEDHDQIWTDTDGTGVVRAYAAIGSEYTYVAVTGMRESYYITAKWPMEIEVFDVRDGSLLESITLEAGESFTFRQHGALRDYLHRIRS